MDTYEAITKRHACRAYSDEPLTAEETKKLIEAANAAPAGMGDYTEIKLTVVQDKKLIEAIEVATAHDEKNKSETLKRKRLLTDIL